MKFEPLKLRKIILVPEILVQSWDFGEASADILPDFEAFGEVLAENLTKWQAGMPQIWIPSDLTVAFGEIFS